MALNTNPITEFRTELKTLPISADLYTESFIQDLAVTDVESLLEQYSPAGFGGANPTTSGQGLGRAGDYNAQSTTVLRGLATGENLTWRNGFLPHWEPNDSYSRGRVEESLVAARSSLRSNFRHHEVEAANGKVRRRLLVERSSLENF